mgnify:CR=1 FL=1
MQRIVTDIKECEDLWKKFSPHEDLWDEWEVVFSMYHPEIHEPYFIHIENESGSGLLPLMHDGHRYQRYFHFGGNRPENRRFWFPKEMLKDFYDALPKDTSITDIDGFTIEEYEILNWGFNEDLLEQYWRYILEPGAFDFDTEKYLESFSKKHRKNIKYDLRKLSNLNYELVWGGGEYVDDLIRLSIGRFGEESDFSDDWEIKEFKSFAEAVDGVGTFRTLVILVEGRVVGVEAMALFRDHYHVLTGAFDSAYENLGKLLIMETIKQAFDLRVKEIDFMTGGGWKDLWNLEARPVYTLRK